MIDLNANRFFVTNKYPQTPENIAPIIIACGLKTPENIGHLIRVAGNAGSQKVMVVHSGKLFRSTKIDRIAGAANSVVDCRFCTINELHYLLTEDYEIIALETAPRSTNLFETTLPVKMALMIGNETAGIPAELLNMASRMIHIPVTGKIKSLNVSHAAAICLFEWSRQIVL